jgi:hypothetical protein
MKGEYLVCIDNSNTIMFHESINPIELTIGKSYKVLNVSQYMITDGFYNTITIVDDSLVGRCDYRLERFITLQQWREKQLNFILDEIR